MQRDYHILGRLDDGSFQGSLLASALPLAVYSHIRRNQSRTLAAIWQDTVGVAELLGSRGDVLLHGSKNKGEAAAIFNRVAAAVAALALTDGGCFVLGTRYEAKHPELG